MGCGQPWGAHVALALGGLLCAGCEWSNVAYIASCMLHSASLCVRLIQAVLRWMMPDSSASDTHFKAGMPGCLDSICCLQLPIGLQANVSAVQ